jgi:ABC-2 family transporter protein
MDVILILLGGEIRRLLRNGSLLAFMFLAPALLILLTGETLGLSRSTAPRPIPLAVVNESPAPAATRLMDALRKFQALRLVTVDATTGAPITEAGARERIRAGSLRFALLLSTKPGAKMRLLGNPRNAPEMETVQALLAQASSAASGGSAVATEEVGGAHAVSPDATRVVAGWATFFLLLALLGVGASLFHEKKIGLYQRLLVGPVHPAQVVMSKFLFGVLFGSMQLSLLFLLGSLLLGIPLATHLARFLLVAFAVSSAASAFSLLLAAITPGGAVMRWLGLLLALTMALVCANWFLPAFPPQLSSMSLISWATRGFVQVLWGEADFRALLPTLGVLFGFAVLGSGFTLWRWDRRRFLT